MECSLVMFKSDGTRRDIPLVGDRNVIGRMSTCQVRIPLDRVSREHCELLCDGQTLSYKDLNSSNGVMHNGAKSKKGTLKPGDELVIGPVVFTVMIDGKPSKITPIRTIVDDGTEEPKKAQVEQEMDFNQDDSQICSAVTHAGLDMAAVNAPRVATVPHPKTIGSSAKNIQPVGGESDFEEFNTPVKAGKQPPAMPEPIGGDDPDDGELIPMAKAASGQIASGGDGLAPMPGNDSGTFELMEDGDGEEESAFTFD